MTTRQFIAKTINTTSYNSRQCSSVFTDNRGVVFSYGWHYPLAAVINGKGYVNNAGYSVTTAKHINWAFSALHDLGYEVHGVPLSNGNSLTQLQVHESALRELKRLEAVMSTKKRKDTNVYQDLERQATNMTEAIRALSPTITI